MTETKYKTIVIDPPWKIKHYPNSLNMLQGSQFAQTLPYNTMTDDEILSFPIDDFAAKDTLLFLWTTHSKLEFSFKILQHWKMKFHVLLTWHKHDGICMSGFCRNTEPCLIAYKGSLKANTDNKHPLKLNIDQTAGRHSEKPSKFYDALYKSTQAPRIDIFGRRHHYGFDAWGDQVEADSQKRL